MKWLISLIMILVLCAASDAGFRARRASSGCGSASQAACAPAAAQASACASVGASVDVSVKVGIFGKHCGPIRKLRGKC